MIKARITRKGSLALIVTERGQKALVPWNTLCKFLEENNIIPENMNPCENT